MASPKFPVYPRIARRQFVKWNEEMFTRYNNERVYHHPNPLIRWVENIRVKTLLSLLSPIKPTDCILAAGCGEGYIEKHLPCNHLYLVDISKEAIRRACTSIYPAKKTSFFIADLEKLPFSKALFDKIECSEVIEHVYSPENLLKELFRVIKPQGNLIISFPNEPFINFIKQIFIRLGIFHLVFPNVPPDMTQEWHLHAFTLEKFRQLSQNKWQITQIRPIPSVLFPIRYVIKCRPLN